jgi:DNA-binding NtrC family response regulator
MEKRKKILVCDDELGVREAINLILSDSYDLDFVSSGAEAISKVKKTHFDGIIMDIKMPIKNGLETLAEIKSISPGSNVIIVTGYQSVETAAKAIKFGASDYITKPFESCDLLEKVRNIFSY